MRAERETVLFSYQDTWQPKNQLRQFIKGSVGITEIEQIPTILETDANAHHTIWGSSDINPQGRIC